MVRALCSPERPASGQPLDTLYAFAGQAAARLNVQRVVPSSIEISPGGRVHELRSSGGLPDHLSGAPLDVIKLAAAGLMLGDHVNTSLLNSGIPLLWRFGRIAFPLFCFVLACHLMRGAVVPRYT